MASEQVGGDGDPAAGGSGKYEASEYVKLKVVSDGLQEIYFKLKRNAKFLKLKQYYSKHLGLAVDSLKFLVDGERVSDDDTPDKLHLRDNDQIDVYYSQTGGFTSP